MTRLKRVSPSQPGWSRRRAGKGFSYRDESGNKLPPEAVERIKALAIPPAWTDVWICPLPNGHLQATGTDDAGRRQYLYHPLWRTRRDRSKFERVQQAAGLLPRARRRVAADLAAEAMPLTRACAAAVRLLDVGYFRIGNDAYTDAHGSFGLTTLQRDHVRRTGEHLVFSFTGKSGVHHTIEVDDPAVVEALEVMRQRRDGSHGLLAYHDDQGWHELTSSQVNSYLADLFDGTLTAKDFRTWHAGVIAAEALALAEEPGDSQASQRRAIKAAVTEVSQYLGNTPAMARSSYVDPRIIDKYEAGHTIAAEATRKHRTPESRRRALEEALLDLLE